MQSYIRGTGRIVPHRLVAGPPVIARPSSRGRGDLRHRAQVSDHDVKGDDMPYYQVAGEIPRKRHIRYNRPDGGLYAEELMGEEGFTADSSLLYHVNPPTAIVKSEAVSDAVSPANL